MNFKKRLFKYWIKCYCYNNTYILWAKRNIRPAYLSNLLLLVTSPYILVTWVISILSSTYKCNFLGADNKQ